MKTYNTLPELKKDWFTVQELFNVLEENGFKFKINSLKRWEKAGIIPVPKRVIFKRLEWRVYKKDSSDFKEILIRLGKNSSKVINMPKTLK